MDFIVYVLYSRASKKIYIGFTSNLIERFKSHNSLGTKGWTIKFRPWQVVYIEVFEDKTSAMKRERTLKGAKSRSEIVEKINECFEEAGFISAPGRNEFNFHSLTMN